MLLPNRSQYLIEMSTVEEATHVVNMSAASPVLVHGRPIRVQFGRSPQISRTSAIPLDPHAAAAMSRPPSSGPTGGGSGRVLHISVQNVYYPITVDVLDKILRPFGDLLRVVIFEKDKGLQALAEFRTPQEAETVMRTLQGREIYDQCCKLFIQISKNDSVNVKENSDKQRDFTNPSLPWRGGATGPVGIPQAAPYPAAVPYAAAGYGYMPQPAYGMPAMPQYGSHAMAPPRDARDGRYGYAPPPSAPYYPPHDDKRGGFNDRGPPPYNSGSMHASAPMSRGRDGAGRPEPSPVLMIYNRPTEATWPHFSHEHMYNLLCIYGDVLRIRLMSKPDNGAMAEFANPRMVGRSHSPGDVSRTIIPSLRNM